MPAYNPDRHHFECNLRHVNNFGNLGNYREILDLGQLDPKSMWSASVRNPRGQVIETIPTLDAKQMIARLAQRVSSPGYDSQTELVYLRSYSPKETVPDVGGRPVNKRPSKRRTDALEKIGREIE